MSWQTSEVFNWLFNKTMVIVQIKLRGIVPTSVPSLLYSKVKYFQHPNQLLLHVTKYLSKYLRAYPVSSKTLLQSVASKKAYILPHTHHTVKKQST